MKNYLLLPDVNIATRKMGRFDTVFSAPQEEDLVLKILDQEQRFYGLSTRDIRSLAYQLAVKNNITHPFSTKTELAGLDWLQGFRRRHPEISLRTPEATSAARAQGFNHVSVSQFFNVLEAAFESGDFPASRVYNVDETSVMTVRIK